MTRKYRGQLCRFSIVCGEAAKSQFEAERAILSALRGLIYRPVRVSAYGVSTTSLVLQVSGALAMFAASITGGNAIRAYSFLGLGRSIPGRWIWFFSAGRDATIWPTIYLCTAAYVCFSTGTDDGLFACLMLSGFLLGLFWPSLVGLKRKPMN